MGTVLLFAGFPPGPAPSSRPCKLAATLCLQGSYSRSSAADALGLDSHSGSILRYFNCRV